MMLKMINGYMLVEFEPYVDRKTDSGFFLADPKHEGLPYKGTIIAIDKKITHLKAGDRVIYKEDHPEGFEWEGYKVIRVHSDNVLAKLKEGE